MRNFFRLLRYGLPYTLQWMPGVLLLAVVGVLDALRMALFVPILSVVLKPDNPSNALPLLPNLPSRWQFDVHQFVPAWMHNAWTVVAFTLVVSTVLKGICDYTGTYLVNYAGFATLQICATICTLPYCGGRRASSISTQPGRFFPP